MRYINWTTEKHNLNIGVNPRYKMMNGKCNESRRDGISVEIVNTVAMSSVGAVYKKCRSYGTLPGGGYLFL